MPYVVEVDRLGEVRAVGPALEAYQPSDAQIAHFLARFIENVRSLSIDPVIVRTNWLRAYDFVTDRGAQALNEYAREADPFTKIGSRTVTAEVTSVVRASSDSFEIRWKENTYENGAIAKTERFTGRRHHRSQAARRCRDAAEESARPLRPFPQLVARPHRRRQMKSIAITKLASASVLALSLALGGCATKLNLEAPYDEMTFEQGSSGS